LGRAAHHGFGAQKSGGATFCDFVGRIADIPARNDRESISGLDGVGVDLLELLVAFLALGFASGGVVVEAAGRKSAAWSVRR